MQEFQPNDTIAIRYKVIRKLGAGAMGSVYLCEDSVENNIKVALKVLVSENIDDQDIWAKGEYEALTRLRHPNLARVFNFGRIGDSRDYFIVSEFIKGIDLYSATEYLNYEELVDIIVQISRALEYIHSQGYVHFDIKPDNILVTRYKTVGIKEGSKVQYTEADLSSSKRSVFAKPNVKLIDFGLAEKITGSFNFAIKGTLNYLAPEILNGMTPDKRADLYSLGVTLYQVANRDLPFYQDSDNIFATAAPAKRSDLFGIHMKKHPEFLRLLILKLIEERPEDRFQSAKEIIQFINKHSEYHFDVETAETRASYFYSPKLVARRREINLLKEYHERAFFPHRWQERRTRAVLQEQRKRALIAAGEVGTAVLRAGDVGALPSVDSRSDPDAANGAAATGPEVRTLAATEANEVPTEARLEKEVSTPSEAIPAPAAELPEAEVDATQLEAEELDADLDADDLDDPSLELDGVLDGDAAGSGDDCLPTADLPALILVSGEMGSGKSRLLEEFQHYLKLNDLSLFVGNCYEGNNKAYQPFLEALRQLVFAFGLDSELYRKYSQDLLKLLPELPAKKDELELAVGFRADKEKLYFIERIAQLFIEAAQSSPYILIINNLHWVDEASTDLLKHFLRRLAELRTKSEQVTMLVLASVRPEELHLDHVRDLLSELKKAGECREIPVRRLKHSQIREFLCAMLNFSGVPEDFVRKLEEKTGGNPLFIVETLKALQEDGVLRMVGDGWVIKATNYDRIEIPQSMEDLLEKRLGKIPAQRREILDILSVLDKPVNPKFIQGIERFREIPLLVELRDLEATGLITKTFDGGKLHFQIAQPKVREILYSRIEAEKRKKYHGEVGAAFLEAFRGKEDEILEELAYHYQRSDQPAKALELALKAGDRLKAIYANERACEYYRYVLEQVEGDATQLLLWVETQEKLGDISTTMGCYEQAERSYGALLETEVRKNLDPQRVVKIYIARGKVFEIQGDYEQALKCFKDARNFLATFDKKKLVSERIHVFNSIGWVYVCMGKYEKAMAISIEALRVIEGMPERIEHAMVYNTIGSASYYKGNTREAIEYHRRSLQIRENFENIPEITISLNNLGNAHMAGNEYGEAAELFQRALRTSEQIGDPYGKAVSLHNYAKLFFAIGQEERAWEAMDESLRLSKLYNMRFLNIQNYIVRGKALCDQADYAKAEGNFFRALTAFSKQGNRWGLCTVLLHICELHRLRGRIKEARAMLAEARRYADELDIHNLRVQCFVEDARLIRDESSEGQVPQESALRVLEQALGICEKCDNAELTGEVNYEIGETMVRLRRLREAPQFYRAAEEKFREVLENLPEAFRQSYSERQKSRFRDWKAPTTSAKSSDMEKLSAARADGSTESSGMITAEDSLRRVNQLMMLLCERGPLKSFLDLLIEDVLAVFRAEGAFLLRIRGDDLNVEMARSPRGGSPPDPDGTLCLDLIERVLNQKGPLLLADVADDPQVQHILEGQGIQLSALVIAAYSLGQEATGVLYVLNPRIPRGGAESSLWLFQPYLNLVPLAYAQLSGELAPAT